MMEMYVLHMYSLKVKWIKFNINGPLLWIHGLENSLKVTGQQQAGNNIPDTENKISFDRIAVPD